jgi:hypothetical protein
MTMSNHKLRVQGIRVVEIREVPVEVLELFETMESKS